MKIIVKVYLRLTLGNGYISQIISWSGSIEIGVTECDPETLEIPSCAINLRHGSWIMTGSGIVHDGDRIVEIYGMDLTDLEEGSTLGVMRTSNVNSYFVTLYPRHFCIEINGNLLSAITA